MTVDLTPLLQAAMSLAVLVLGTVGTWALTRLGQKLGIQTTQAQQQQIETVINKAVQAGAVLAEDAARTHGWDHPVVKSQILASAIQYAADRFPDTLKQAGIDPSNAADAAQLRSAIARALPAAVTPVASSPATTNGPEPVMVEPTAAAAA